jgi:hypothetical protein
VEHQLEGEGPWGLPDGSEDCEIIFTPGHTEAHCVMLYKPQKVILQGMHHTMGEDGPSATSHVPGSKAQRMNFGSYDYTMAAIALQVLFSGDHLAANAVGEWTSKYEDADDGFLGISRNFNCEPHGFILRNLLLHQLALLKCFTLHLRDFLLAAALIWYSWLLGVLAKHLSAIHRKFRQCPVSGMVQVLMYRSVYMQGGVLTSRLRAAQSWQHTTGSQCCRVCCIAISACNACIKVPGSDIHLQPIFYLPTCAPSKKAL